MGGQFTLPTRFNAFIYLYSLAVEVEESLTHETQQVSTISIQLSSTIDDIPTAMTSSTYLSCDGPDCSSMFTTPVLVSEASVTVTDSSPSYSLHSLEMATTSVPGKC